MTTDNKDRKFSRRKFMKTAAAAAAAGGLARGLRDGMWKPQQKKRHKRPPHPDADLMLVNGRIHTMDPRNRVVSSVRHQDGRLRRGRPLQQVSGTETRPRSSTSGAARGAGHHRQPNHFVLMGNRPGYQRRSRTPIPFPDVQAIYAARAPVFPAAPGSPPSAASARTISTANPADPLSGRMPTLAELDAAVPNNPVFLEVGFTGPGRPNSAGKAIFQSQASSWRTTAR